MTAADAASSRYARTPAAETRRLVEAAGTRRRSMIEALATLVAHEPRLAAHAALAQQASWLLADEPDATARRLLASPLVGGWLNGFGRVGSWASDDPQLARQLRLWPAMLLDLRPDSAVEVEQELVDGWWLTWDPRVALRLPGHERVRVRKQGPGLVLCDLRGRRLAEARLDAAVGLRADGLVPPPQLPASEVVVRNDLPPLRLLLREDRVPTREGTVVPDAHDDREGVYAPFEAEPLLQAGQLVAAHCPEEYDDWRATLQVVVPRTMPAGWTVGGFTVSSHQGACWIVAREPLLVLETLVHEQSHVKLRYLEREAPLLGPEQTDALFPVRWRSDPRPIVGIYEGVYVHLHCTAALRRLVEREALAPPVAARASARVGALAAQLVEGVAILREHARYTPEGRRFQAWAEAEVAALAPA